MLVRAICTHATPTLRSSNLITPQHPTVLLRVSSWTFIHTYFVRFCIAFLNSALGSMHAVSCWVVIFSQRCDFQSDENFGRKWSWTGSTGLRWCGLKELRACGSGHREWQLQGARVVWDWFLVIALLIYHRLVGGSYAPQSQKQVHKSARYNWKYALKPQHSLCLQQLFKPLAASLQVCSHKPLLWMLFLLCLTIRVPT